MNDQPKQPSASKLPKRHEGMRCDCGAVISAVTWTCVLGVHCPEVKNSAEQEAQLFRRAIEVAKANMRGNV